MQEELDDADPFSSLPAHIHDGAIVQQSARGSITQVRRNRLVSQSFSQPSSRLVKTLESGTACGIPSGTWISFPLADGLRIDLCKSEEQPLWSSLVQDMLDRAPLGRLKRVALVSEGSQEKGSSAARRLLPSLSTFEERHALVLQRLEQQRRLERDDSWSWHIAQALVSSASTAGLQQVRISVAMSTTAADTIISSLPELQELAVTIGMPYDHFTRWGPAAGKQLRSLKIISVYVPPEPTQQLMQQGSYVSNSPGSRDLHVDMHAVAQSTQLEELHLGDEVYNGPVYVDNWAAVADLKQLQVLSLFFDNRRPDNPSTRPDHIHVRVLLQLPLLHTLATNWEVLDWQVLAQLPALRILHLSELQLLPGSSSVSSSITELYVGIKDNVGDGLRLVPHLGAELGGQVAGYQVPAGLLARIMPALEVCKVHADVCVCTQDMLRLLQGHSRLRRCMIDCGLYGERGWPQGLLAGSLENLEELELYTLMDDVDGMLQDVAGCGKLRALELYVQGNPGGHLLWPEFTGQGLARLADGPCSSSLEVCHLQVLNGPASLSAVAELVGKLPALQQGTFTVEWGRKEELVVGQMVGGDEVEWAQAQYRLLLERLRAAGLQAEAAEPPITSVHTYCAVELADSDAGFGDLEGKTWARGAKVAVRVGGAVLKLHLEEQLEGRSAVAGSILGETWELLPELPELRLVSAIRQPV